VQQRRLHTNSQPLEQLDEVIEEIRRLMLRLAKEAINKGKLSRSDVAPLNPQVRRLRTQDLSPHNVLKRFAMALLFPFRKICIHN
jgi:hypothetical protein